jgi:hypothetical protein
VTDRPDSRLGGNVPVDGLHEIYGPEAWFAVAAKTCLPTTKWDEEMARGLEVGLPGGDVRTTSCAELGTSGVVAVTLADAAAFPRASGGERLAVTTTVVPAGVHVPLELPEGWCVDVDGTSSVSLQPEHIGDSEQEHAA